MHLIMNYNLLKMKNFIFTLAAICVMASLASCQKSDFFRHPGGEGDADCELMVCIGDGFTKVVGQTSAAENKINDVQIFVFNTSTGKLDAAAHSGGLSSDGGYTMAEKLNCTRGARQVWAIVNSKVNYVDGVDINRVKTIDELQLKTSALTDNEPSSFIMAGKIDVKLDADSQTVSVDVRRVCAAICLKSIKNDMIVPAYQTAGAVKITGVYLLNVPNKQNFTIPDSDKTAVGSLSSTVLEKNDWISPTGKSAAHKELLLTSDVYAAADQALEYKAEFSKHSVLYSYPNDATALPGDVWAPSVTTMVVEAIVGGQPCIYPVQLGRLHSNYKYEVSLVLKHVGGDPDNPWKKIEFTDLDAIVKVVDWTTGANVSEVI